MSKDCRPHKNKSILPSKVYKTRCKSQVSTEDRKSRTDTTAEKWCKFCSSSKSCRGCCCSHTEKWLTLVHHFSFAKDKEELSFRTESMWFQWLKSKKMRTAQLIIISSLFKTTTKLKLWLTFNLRYSICYTKLISL